MKNLSQVTIIAFLALLVACHNDDENVKTNECRVGMTTSGNGATAYYYNATTGDLDSISHSYICVDTIVNATTKLEYNASHQLVKMSDIDTYSTFNYLANNQTVTQLKYYRDSPATAYMKDTLVFEFNEDGSLMRNYNKSSPKYYSRYEYNEQGNLKIVYITSHFNEQETPLEEFLEYDNKKFPFRALLFGELIEINESDGHRNYKLSTTYEPMFAHNVNNAIRYKLYYYSPKGDPEHQLHINTIKTATR